MRLGSNVCHVCSFCRCLSVRTSTSVISTNCVNRTSYYDSTVSTFTSSSLDLSVVVNPSPVLRPGRVTVHLHDPAMSNIKVAVRVRPLSQAEIDGGDQPHWTIKDNSMFPDDKVDVVHTFDRVFGPSQCNSDVYREIGQPLVESVMKGFNGTLFAYGQTASGKTHTMMGTDQEMGLIPLAVKEVFNIIENVPDREYLLRISYLEIYNENLHDLMKTPSGSYFQSLQLRENSDGEPYVQDLTEQTVCSMEAVMKAMQLGERHRHIGCTNLNARSSRSHTIFKMVIESRVRGEEEDNTVTVSHLNLVDLAGSERTTEARTTGERFREGNFINTSLMALSRVISMLSRGEQGFINYRDSKLTRILQNSLGGNAHTAIVCTVTPSSVLQTSCTLRFASSAKKICNRPVVNEVVSDSTMMRRYHREIQTLRQKMKAMEDGTLTKTLQEKDSTIESLSRKVEELERQLVVSTHSLPQLMTPVPAVERRCKRRETWGGSRPRSALPVLCMAPALPVLKPPRPVDTPQPRLDLSTIEELPETTGTSATRSSTGLPDTAANTSFEAIPGEQLERYLKREELLRIMSPPLDQACTNKNCVERVLELESELARLRREHEELKELTTLERLMCSTSHKVQPKGVQNAAVTLSPAVSGSNGCGSKSPPEATVTPVMSVAALQTMAAQKACSRPLVPQGHSPFLVAASSSAAATNFDDAWAADLQPEFTDLMTFELRDTSSDMDLVERSDSSPVVMCSVGVQTDVVTPAVGMRDASSSTDRVNARERGTSCHLPLRSAVDVCVEVSPNVVDGSTSTALDGVVLTSDVAVGTDAISTLHVETMTDVAPVASVADAGTMTDRKEAKTVEEKGTAVSRSFFEQNVATSPIAQRLERDCVAKTPPKPPVTVETQTTPGCRASNSLHEKSDIYESSAVAMPSYVIAESFDRMGAIAGAGEVVAAQLNKTYFVSCAGVGTEAVSMVHVETMTDVTPLVSVVDAGTLTDCEVVKIGKDKETAVSRSFFEQDVATSPIAQRLEKDCVAKTPPKPPVTVETQTTPVCPARNSLHLKTAVYESSAVAMPSCAMAASFGRMGAITGIGDVVAGQLNETYFVSRAGVGTEAVLMVHAETMTDRTPLVNVVNAGTLTDCQVVKIGKDKETAVSRSFFERDAATSPLAQGLARDVGVNVTPRPLKTISTQATSSHPKSDALRQTARVGTVHAPPAVISATPRQDLVGTSNDDIHNCSGSDVVSQTVSAEQSRAEAARARFPFLTPRDVPWTANWAERPSSKSSTGSSGVHPDELARRLSARAKFPFLKPVDEPWSSTSGRQPSCQAPAASPPACFAATIRAAARSSAADDLPGSRNPKRVRSGERPSTECTAESISSPEKAGEVRAKVHRARPQHSAKTTPAPCQSTAVQTDRWSAQEMDRLCLRLQSLEEDLKATKKAHKRREVELEAEVRRLHQRELNSTVLQPRPTSPNAAPCGHALTAADLAAMTPRSREGARLLQYGRQLDHGGIVEEFRAERLAAQLKLRNREYDTLQRQMKALVSARKHCTCVSKPTKHAATSPLCTEAATENTVESGQQFSSDILFGGPEDEERFDRNCKQQ
ncbi:uncharacterized protein LOC8041507 isoform X1 [Ixodes scapularis]|uniref:uncharacterized protein LOC8041507 isoform X1 n=2 Tax=Ixodes scapularis TaxID=6945 RepID=UPI001A9E441F|nr:uncharacterized protein LOC8041507 isoform X1 [Ixodes scapularis]